MGHEFRARNLTDREWNAIEDFRRAVEKREKKALSDKDLILWVAGQSR
jgi:hypothetical protein